QTPSACQRFAVQGREVADRGREVWIRGLNIFAVVTRLRILQTHFGAIRVNQRDFQIAAERVGDIDRYLHLANRPRRSHQVGGLDSASIRNGGNTGRDD